MQLIKTDNFEKTVALNKFFNLHNVDKTSITFSNVDCFHICQDVSCINMDFFNYYLFLKRNLLLFSKYVSQFIKFC